LFENRGKGYPEVVAAFPMDESIYGVRDLAGSVSEPLQDQRDGEFFVLRGGNWFTANTYSFRVANRNSRKPTDGSGQDSGIQLLAELPDL
jgi:formylglycine-generating enzyme required for sulfatase activity